ncbi:hypothetical protein GO300_01045 [Ralstonia solanacearum]|nr:hypothetical protein [Ralstonia solanacearum]
MAIGNTIGTAPFEAFFARSADANRTLTPTICNIVRLPRLAQKVLNPLIWKENPTLQILTN